MTRLAVALISSVAVARDHILIQESIGDLQHKRPNVEQLSCDTCVSTNDNNKVCITYGASITAGWEFDQEWYDDPLTVDIRDGQYKLGLEVYSQQSAAGSFLFDVEKLYFNNT